MSTATVSAPLTGFLYELTTMVGKRENQPFAPHLVISEVRNLLDHHPELRDHPDRELLITALVWQVERGGLALLTNREVGLWWDYPDFDLNKVLPPGRALPPGWPR